ncbi:MAG: hypothetical protein V7693_16005 [Halopseudomonas sabulinigri]
MTSFPPRQSYPSTKIKLGAVLFSVLAFTDDDGKVVTRIEEWIVRSIRARRNSLTKNGMPVFYAVKDAPKQVNLAQKNQFTWVKKTPKAGDYGWHKSIWAGYLKAFRVGDDLPFGIYTTKRAALKYAIADQKCLIDYYQEDISLSQASGDAQEAEEWQRELRAAQNVQKALERRYGALK